MKGIQLVLGLSLIAILLIAGCMGITGSSGLSADNASVTPTSSAGAPGGAGSSPSVLILDPPFDGGVAAGNVTVSVQVTAFAIMPPGVSDQAGTGHLVYYRDVVPPTASGATALTAPETCAVSSEIAYTWQGIAPGTHTFTVQLVNADNTPLDPPAIDAVDVTAVSSGMVIRKLKEHI